MPGKTTRVLAFGVVFAVGATLLRATIHQSWSDFSADRAYLCGLVLGSGASFALGVLLGWVVNHGSPVRKLLGLGLTALALFAYSAASHYHAVFNRLPSGRSVAKLFGELGDLGTSLGANAPVQWVVAEVALGTLFVALAHKPLARFLESVCSMRIQRVALVGGMGLWLISGVAAQPLAKSPYRQGALHPFVAAMQGLSDVPAASDAMVAQLPVRLKRLQTAMAVPDPTPNDPALPYCRYEDQRGPKKPQNVILLILESVGAREAALPQMSNLQTIKADGVSFERFFASGSQSSQAMVSIFSGIPPETHRRILTHAPLHSMKGIATDLADHGYDTAYFHGSDLSFEQQRAYLRMVGFQTIVEPDPVSDARLGWGVPDGVMFDRLRAWIETRQADQPFFATLFTISTHDPYVIPPKEPQAGSDSRFERLSASLAYLDRELGAFYTWLRASGRAESTLLVITGDHAPHAPHPLDVAQTSTGELELRFEVPLVVVGAGRSRPAVAMAGGHLDIPTTIMGELGWKRRGCYQGRDLFEPPEQPRLLPSIAGEQMHLFFVHDGDYRWMLDLAQQTTRVFHRKRDPDFRHDLVQALGSRRPMIEAFVRDYLAVGAYLNADGHFAPRGEATDRPPRAPPAYPIVVSHRGNTQGPGAQGAPRENSAEAVSRAIAEGWQWIEIDLQVTRDGVVVLAHDAEVAGLNLADHTLAELRDTGMQLDALRDVLERFGDDIGFCLEIKRQARYGDAMSLVEGLLKLLPKAPRAIVDSFGRAALQSIATHADVDVGFDLPQKPVESEWLRFAADSGFAWVYIEQSFATPKVVREAHQRGLKVMVYTVNNNDAPPDVDGVMSDGPRQVRERIQGRHRGNDE